MSFTILHCCFDPGGVYININGRCLGSKRFFGVLVSSPINGCIYIYTYIYIFIYIHNPYICLYKWVIGDITPILG